MEVMKLRNSLKMLGEVDGSGWYKMYLWHNSTFDVHNIWKMRLDL